MGKIISTYSIKIKHYNSIFKDTIKVYRDMVDYLIPVCIDEWEHLCVLGSNKVKQSYIESLCHKTKKYPFPKYPFDVHFPKVPSYIRRAAITEAIGKTSSYKNNLNNWIKEDPATRGREPSFPKAGYVYPSLYRENMYKQTDQYTAQIKVYIRNTWDWITIQLRKTDINYINIHCSARKMCAPTLMKRGKQWFLDFPFEEHTELSKTDIHDQIIASVDLGINSAAAISIMNAEGTVLGRYFLSLPSEKDSLHHSINRIKKAQQHGNRKMPRLWAKAKGINHAIAVKTSHFIIETAVLYNADVIVFEHLDLKGKKKGSKKQKLHLWKAREVQSMVKSKAHRHGIRISRICAWGTSRLAYDGSGYILRGREAELSSYSLCRFSSGKVYNCDLNASYNIGARYFIRGLLKSLPVTERLQLQAKVPAVCKRSTCTLSTLIRLNAAFVS